LVKLTVFKNFCEVVEQTLIYININFGYFDFFVFEDDFSEEIPLNLKAVDLNYLNLLTNI
jgi:hypothetical protein